MQGTQLSLHQVAEDFVRHLETLGRSEHTIRAYHTDLKLFRRWFHKTQGEDDVTAVTPLDLREYRGDMLRHGKKPATINRRLQALRSFFDWATKENDIEFDPTDDVSRVKRERRPAPKHLERTEQLALLRAIQKERQVGTALQKKLAVRDLALVQLMLQAGLRASEVVTLDVDDIEIRERSGQVIVRQGKGSKWREVPLNVDARHALQDHLDEWQPDKQLFMGVRGEPLQTRGLYKMVRKYGDLAEIDDLHPHRLRHTFGMRLREQDTPLDVIADLMGHESIDTTRKFYSAPTEKQRQDAVDAIAYADE